MCESWPELAPLEAIRLCMLSVFVTLTPITPFGNQSCDFHATKLPRIDDISTKNTAIPHKHVANM